jgi:hypothetical protein
MSTISNALVTFADTDKLQLPVRAQRPLLRPRVMVTTTAMEAVRIAATATVAGSATAEALATLETQLQHSLSQSRDW